VYLSQKQFIENASHEIQTPLGVIRNKVDLLVESAPLNPEQASIIISITEHINRLAGLNKTLLLLSKIENKQFSEHEAVDITKLIEECSEDFYDLMEFKNLNLEIINNTPLLLQMNKDLARVLFSNLIKNAVNHNITSGLIAITIDADRFIIKNSGKELNIQPEFLFERFNKKSDNPQSVGLGLAIVKSICTLYNFNISYSYAGKMHTVELVF
jgi:signal transduction histidine kinase